MKPKRSRIRILKNKAWKLMSEIVRREENGICFTCDTRYWNEELGENDWRRLDAGHFIHDRMDYVRENIHAQCRKCNHFLSGNLKSYTLKMIDTYGRAFVDEMHNQAAQEKPMTEEAYKGLIELLTRKLNSLKSATESII